jgi:hypothetical protein
MQKHTVCEGDKKPIEVFKKVFTEVFKTIDGYGGAGGDSSKP